MISFDEQNVAEAAPWTRSYGSEDTPRKLGPQLLEPCNLCGTSRRTIQAGLLEDETWREAPSSHPRASWASHPHQYISWLQFHERTNPVGSDKENCTPPANPPPPPAPASWMYHELNSCFKPLSSEMVCYTGKANWYIREHTHTHTKQKTTLVFLIYSACSLSETKPTSEYIVIC